MARENQLARLIRLADVLGRKRRGWTVRELETELQCARATVYRDLKLLRLAKLPYLTETVNGEVRYRFIDLSLESVRMSHELLTGLVLARKALASISGTPPVMALDVLLKSLPVIANEDASIVDVVQGASSKVETTATVSKAIHRRRRVSILYAGATDPAPRTRTLEPVEIRIADASGYCTAWCLEANAWRTFKLARIHTAKLLPERADAHPPFKAEEVYRQAGVWSGDPLQVKVRLLPHKANLAEEYPLGREPEIAPQSDGSVVVKAAVSHPNEVMQWTLRWGSGAEVLQPSWVRTLVHEELLKAARLYEAPNKVSQTS